MNRKQYDRLLALEAKLDKAVIEAARKKLEKTFPYLGSDYWHIEIEGSHGESFDMLWDITATNNKDNKYNQLLISIKDLFQEEVV